jgi:arginine decarboxylase
MEDFKMHLDQERFSGIDLARMIQRLHPGVFTPLLTGKNIREVVQKGSHIFSRPFWKHDDSELDELFRAIRKELEAKYRTPFWDALRDFSQRPVHTFHAMALSHGRSVKKSVVLDDFLEFYGENYFLAETTATVDPLDSLLHPTGSIEEAEEKAAEVFGAKRTLFVTNGTSTANKIVLQTLLRPGEAILVDRNCHVSHHYGMALMHARPYYLEPYELSKFGISGGIPLGEIKNKLLEHISRYNKGLEENPLPKALMLTNCTFDGVISHPAKIIRKVREVISRTDIPETRMDEMAFFFDEGWFAYGRFLPQYAKYTGMAAAKALCEEDDFYKKHLRVYCTQSTHKTLSAFRQASMIHVRDPVVERDSNLRQRLHWSHRTHTTTSPHAGIIASLDVATRQMALEGCSLVQDAIGLAENFRNDSFNFENTGDSNPWKGIYRILSEEEMIPSRFREKGNRSEWTFRLDPTKITIHFTRGLDGARLKKRLLKKYDIQINKHSENTILTMVTLGSTLTGITNLERVLMELANRIIELDESDAETRREYEFWTESSDGYPLPEFNGFWEGEEGSQSPGGRHDLAFFVNNEDNWDVSWIDIDKAAGCISANFVSPYPPGYPILVPGQKIDRETVKFLMELRSDEIHGMGKEKRVKVMEKND